MRHFQPMGMMEADLVRRAAMELKANPQVWDRFRERTAGADSPHRAVSDVWLRYRDRAEFAGNGRDFVGPHEPVWYPAIDVLPSVREICFRVMAAVHGERLGAVLATLLPAGSQVHGHVDAGWNAEVFEKFAVHLEAGTNQFMWFEDEQGDRFVHPSIPGEVVWFRNTVRHGVLNSGTDDRMVLVVSVQVDKGRRGSCHLGR